MKAVAPITVFSPAKINLYLAVTGLREDGFHDLVSWVAPVNYGDTLELVMDTNTPSGVDRLTCDQDMLPVDAENLVLQAAAAYREYWKPPHALNFHLTKRIPVGAGLGGGSSNAVAALEALQQLSGNALSSEQIYTIAARLGSDCPLFLDKKTKTIRGRGERLEALPDTVVSALADYQLLLFKPSAGVSTPWAYGKLKAAKGALYTPKERAEAELGTCLEALHQGNTLPLRNDFERVVFEKWVVFDPLFARLQELGYQPRMSGSGSACFVLAHRNSDTSTAESVIRESLGNEGFLGNFGFDIMKKIL